MNIKRVNKYMYGWALYVDYGYGWEYELFEETYREIRQRFKEYRENCPQYAVKYNQRRELNPTWEKLNKI